MRKLIIFVLLTLNTCCVFAQKVMVSDLSDNKKAFDEIIVGEKPVIVSFWATWCKPCMAELEAIKDIYDEWDGKIRIIAVSIDDSRAKNKVKALVNGKNWTYEVYVDTNKDLYKAMNLSSIPFTMVFYKGKKVYTHSGYNPGDEEALIEKALSYAK